MAACTLLTCLGEYARSPKPSRRLRGVYKSELYFRTKEAAMAAIRLLSTGFLLAAMAAAQGTTAAVEDASIGAPSGRFWRC